MEPKPTATPPVEAPPPQPAPSGATPPAAAKDLLSDLTEDRLPPASGETPPTPPEPKPLVEPTVKPPVEPGKPPEAQRYKVGDREFTLEDLVKSGRLDDLLITYGKHQSLTQKHEEVRAQLDDLQRKALDKERTPPAEPQQITPDRVQATYAAVLAEDVKQGWLEADVAELYPRTASTVRFHIDRIDGLMQAMNGLAKRFFEVENKVLGISPDDVFGRLDKDLTTLSGDDKRKEFGLLKDKKSREGFVEYLKTLDPRVKQLQDLNFLAQQFYAFNNDAIQEAMRQAAEQKPDEKTRRAQAAGEGRPGGRPPAPPAPVPGSHLETLIEDVLPPPRR